MLRPSRSRLCAWLAPALLASSFAATASAQGKKAPEPPHGKKPPAPAGDPASAVAAADETAKKDDARKAFEQGLALFNAGQVDAALAEFQRSIQLYPTRAATLNSAVALRKLGRFDEALDTLQALLEKYPSMAANDRASAEKEITELSALVGFLDVKPSETGATITIDGRTRGLSPLKAPLRVPGGTHTVKVDKDGFKLFETTVTVAGRATVPVVAKLGALEQAGRLFVTEDRDRKVAVIVDGFVRGNTPWEGAVPIGVHTVLLQGEGDVGTPPTPVDVRLNQLTRVSFIAEPLPCTLRVEPTPANATVSVDSVDVGHGIWEGRLRCGGHKIEVISEGFVRDSQERSLKEAAPLTVKVSLERIPQNIQRPSAVVLDLRVAPVFAPSLGGALAESCKEGCKGGLGVGALGQLGVGYRLGNGFGFGGDLGFLALYANYENRPETLQPTGRELDRGRAYDNVAHRGPLLGASVSFTRPLGKSERLALRGRLGGGVFFDFWRDDRHGYFQANPLYVQAWSSRGEATARPGTTYDAGSYRATGTFLAPYVNLEARAAYALSKMVSLEAGIQGFAFLGLSKASWPSDRAVFAGPGGIGVFGQKDKSQPLTGDLVFAIAPFVGASFAF